MGLLEGIFEVLMEGLRELGDCSGLEAREWDGKSMLASGCGA